MTGTATLNDAGLASGGVLYDYSGGSAPAKALDSYFFIYNKDTTAPDGKAAKILSWVDLTDKGAASPAAVSAAITPVGGANFTRLSSFDWWKSSVNWRQSFTSTSDGRGKQVPVLTDADNADGWRINQVTYPEIVDLLKNGAQDANAVILFGGTWCPNTRPVIPAINKYAQQNDVQVFNFDTVLDGGTVGGSTTGAVNPLQTRNTVNYTGTGGASNSNPTSLYGDLVSQYLGEHQHRVQDLFELDRHLLPGRRHHRRDVEDDQQAPGPVRHRIRRQGRRRGQPRRHPAVDHRQGRRHVHRVHVAVVADQPAAQPARV